MGDNWKTHAKSLSKVGYKVHLIDQRNHGKSFWSNSFNYSLMASDLVNYCNTHNLHKALFLGHSMGGKVAMNLACEFPERNCFIEIDFQYRKQLQIVQRSC